MRTSYKIYFRELEKINIPKLRHNFWSYSRHVNRRITGYVTVDETKKTIKKASKFGILIFGSSLICIFLLMSVATVSGEFYEYIDENGIIHYTNNLTTIPYEYRSQLNRFEETKTVPEEKKMLNRDEQPSTDPSQTLKEKDNSDMDEAEKGLPDDQQAKISPGMSAAGTSGKKAAESPDMSEFKKKKNALMNRKEALDHKLKNLLTERDQLENSRNKTDDLHIRKYNQDAKVLNEKIKQFKEEDAVLRVEIEAFNESINAPDAKTKQP